ncbi:MAG: septum formation initiator family protein [Bacteroidetes bacterium]|nr:septum formation initiator family protein [Bacteroidota bacterium]
MLKKILHIFKNKYIIITLVFFTWLLVFDKNNFLSQIELNRKLKQVKEDRKYYLEQIKKNQIETQELLTNPENLEKFAREKYLMKRDSEDIFLIIREDSDVKKPK